MMQSETNVLVEKARSGDKSALAQLFDMYRERLRRMVALRQDARVRARFDASDVVQEVFVDVARRLPSFEQSSELPFYLWLRSLAGERLIQLHRMHLSAEKRAVQKELHQPAMPEASALFLASQLAGNFTSVDRGLMRCELQQKIQEALNTMDQRDREVLALRHFEELSTEEIAEVLGLTRSGVLKRHTRALRRLSQLVNEDSDMKID
ncbi:MAG: sigma-70 family RNA polymerase sigma factor [Pirellulales bacterium]|nr:sigma-70 family RNA polymerase sigma factor [Pirellulales bacterium]